MRAVILLTAVVLGLGNASNALADTSVARPEAQLAVQQVDNQTSNSNTVTNAQADGKEVAVQKVRHETTHRRGFAPLRGEMAWFLAGAAGALLPLVLFALPALWLAWFGPFAPLAFLVAIGVGTVATGIGGAVAWLVSAIFSDMKSGFLVPILASAAVGLGATFISGVLAAGIIWAGIGVSWLLSGARNIWDVIFNPNLRNPLGSVPSAIMVGAVGLGFLTWGAGVLAASVLGPMTAAYLYRANGTPKYTETAVTVDRPADDYRGYDRDPGYDRDYGYPDAEPLPATP